MHSGRRSRGGDPPGGLAAWPSRRALPQDVIAAYKAAGKHMDETVMIFYAVGPRAARAHNVVVLRWSAFEWSALCTRSVCSMEACALAPLVCVRTTGELAWMGPTGERPAQQN